LSTVDYNATLDDNIQRELKTNLMYPTNSV